MNVSFYIIVLLHHRVCWIESWIVEVSLIIPSCFVSWWLEKADIGAKMQISLPLTSHKWLMMCVDTKDLLDFLMGGFGAQKCGKLNPIAFKLQS